MKLSFLTLILLAVLFSCNKDKNSITPSTIEFTINTYGDLTGGVFGEKQILVRTIMEYGSDEEHNVLGGITIFPDDSTETIDINGWGNSIHPNLKQIWIRIPNNGVDGYHFDPEYSNDEHFFLEIEAVSGSVLMAGNIGYWGIPNTNLGVTIHEITDDRIKGSFSGELLYFDVDSSGKRTLNEEISNVNIPVINGSFDVKRFD